MAIDAFPTALSNSAFSLTPRYEGKQTPGKDQKDAFAFHLAEARDMQAIGDTATDQKRNVESCSHKMFDGSQIFFHDDQKEQSAPALSPLIDPSMFAVNAPSAAAADDVAFAQTFDANPPLAHAFLPHFSPSNPAPVEEAHSDSLIAPLVQSIGLVVFNNDKSSAPISTDAPTDGGAIVSFEPPLLSTLSVLQKNEKPFPSDSALTDKKLSLSDSNGGFRGGGAKGVDRPSLALQPTQSVYPVLKTHTAADYFSVDTLKDGADGLMGLDVRLVSLETTPAPEDLSIGAQIAQAVHQTFDANSYSLAKTQALSSVAQSAPMSPAQKAPGPARAIVLELQPEALGTVRLNFRFSGDAVRMTIEVVRPQSLAAVKEARDDIQQALQHSGFFADAISIVPAQKTDIPAEAPFSGQPNSTGQGSASAQDRQAESDNNEASRRDAPRQDKDKRENGKEAAHRAVNSYSYGGSGNRML